MSRVLVLFREGPAQSARVRDTLDIALAALAFDHEVRVLFLGDAVALLHGVDAGLAANLRALAYHGAEAIGVDAAGAAGIAREFGAQPLDALQVRAWLERADHVFAC